MPTDSRDKGRIFDEIKSRGKEERKAAELEGFAAWYIKEGLYSTNHLSWTYDSVPMIFDSCNSYSFTIEAKIH